jgi:hypothetical protein
MARSMFGAEAPGLAPLIASLRGLRDGRKLRADLGTALRRAQEPIRDKARGEIKAMPSAGLRKSGPPLRAAIAREVRSEVKLEGNGAGARLIAGNGSMPRNFKHAPARTVASRGWRHPVFGHMDRWVTQQGKRGWFYRPQREGEKEYREAILKVLAEFATKIARRG